MNKWIALGGTVATAGMTYLGSLVPTVRWLTDQVRMETSQMLHHTSERNPTFARARKKLARWPGIRLDDYGYRDDLVAKLDSLLDTRFQETAQIYWLTEKEIYEFQAFCHQLKAEKLDDLSEQRFWWGFWGFLASIWMIASGYWGYRYLNKPYTISTSWK